MASDREVTGIARKEDTTNVAAQPERVRVQNPNFSHVVTIVGNWRRAACFQGITHEVDFELVHPRAELRDGRFHLVLPHNMDTVTLCAFMHYLVSRANFLDVKDVLDELHYEYAKETAGVDEYARVYGGNSADVEEQRKLALAMIDYAATEVLVHGVECPIQLAGSGSDRLSQLTNNRVRGLLE